MTDLTFQTTYEGSSGRLHNLEVSGYWEDNDADHITGPRGKFFVPDQVRLMCFIPALKRWKKRLLPGLYDRNRDLWYILSEEADEVMRDMAWEASY